MATLSIINNFSLPLLGNTFTGKQGAAADDFLEPFEHTVDGKIHYVSSTLATASAVTLWDEDNDAPTTGDYIFFWADQDVHLQLIAQATNVIVPVEANVPFVLGGGSTGLKILAAADTTAITNGGSTLSQIDSVVLGNSSGSTVNYVFALID